jgi:hypothetical protein
LVNAEDRIQPFDRLRVKSPDSVGLFNIPATGPAGKPSLREFKIKNLEHWEEAFEEIMNKFIFPLRPSPYMLNNRHGSLKPS